MKIHGSTALVTGANRGLGAALVQALLEAGATKVYAAARDPSRVVAAPGVVPLQLDVTNPEDIAAAVRQAGDVDLLINNAGIMGGERDILSAASLGAMRREFETNVVAPLALVQAFAPQLAARRGALVNVLSVLSWISLTGAETYSASKAAAWSLSNGLRHVLRERDVQLVSVHVGYMDTDMTRALPVEKADPRAVARATLAAVDAGEVEVLADALSGQVKHALSAGIYLQPVARG